MTVTGFYPQAESEITVTGMPLEDVGLMDTHAVMYWRKGEALQNFGDYLSEFFLEELFFPVGLQARGIHLIGSVIDALYVPPLDKDVRGSKTIHQDERIIFWGCGVRDAGGLTAEQWRRTLVLSVRGPLSASELRLGAAAPQGDPALLLPSLYRPQPMPEFAGKTICIPHFWDDRTDADLLAISGCADLVRPHIPADAYAVRRFIDSVVSADFVLSASLHGAVVAAAYGKPFGFWDNGTIDLPFKWADFAASIGVPVAFHSDLDAARAHYETVTRPAIVLPSLMGALAVAPYLPRPHALLKVVRNELAALPAEQMLGALDRQVALFSQRESHFDGLVQEYNGAWKAAVSAAESARRETAVAHGAAEVARRETAVAQAAAETARRDASHAAAAARQHFATHEAHLSAELETARIAWDHAAAELRGQLATAQLARHEAENEAEALRRSHSWRLTAPLRGAIRALRWAAAPQKLTGNADRRHRLRRVAGPGGPKGAGRMAIYGLGRLMARAPGGNVARQAMQRLMPGPYRWLHIRYGIYRQAAEPQTHQNTAAHDGARNTAFAGPALVAPFWGEPGGKAILAAPVLPRVLFIDSRLPRPDRDSGSLDAMAQMRALLGFGYEVLFIGDVDFAERTPYRARLQAEGVTCISSALCVSVEEFLRRDGASLDLCILSRVTSGGRYLEALRRFAPGARVIFNTVDLHHVRLAREAQQRGDIAALHDAALVREREFYLVRQSDATIVVSGTERALVEAQVPGAAVVEMPLVRPVRAPDRVPGFGARRGVGFVGGFDHTPNVDAVRYLLADIWPLVLARLPAAELSIVGMDLPAELQANLPQGVRYLGAIPDIDPWLDGLRLTVAPLRYGAGAKGKVASSLAASVPCVATPVAVEGMHLEDGVHIAVGDTAARFAALICEVHESPVLWQSLAAGGYARASGEHGIAAGVRRVAALLRQLNLPAGPADHSGARQ